MRSRLGTLIFFLSAVLSAAAFISAETVRADVAEPLDGYVAAIATELDPHVADALARIDGTGRRLLALRSYLRGNSHLAERWSWTQEQIAAYQSSPEHRALQEAIDRVNASFMSANPGYELWVNPDVRSLDVQIEHWNTNESVAAAAEALAAAAREHVGSPAFAAAGPGSAARKLQSFLGAYVPVPTPTIAAPGLSPHGQMRAVDFQVHQGGRVIAGPRISTMEAEWDTAGWSARLEAAVRSASRQFVGPLASPREPWHYTYSPEAVASAGP
jgi:hypothetical protein